MTSVDMLNGIEQMRDKTKEKVVLSVAKSKTAFLFYFLESKTLGNAL